eukprot:scaffold10.g2276.t1
MEQHSRVPRRPLGNTGLEVSVLGFGASPLGGVYQEFDEAACIEAVAEAFRLGINFFDTSPYYGATKSETVLGKALQQLPREQVILATKVGRYGAETFDFRRARLLLKVAHAERVTASVHESLARLQTTYIDLIQTHDIEFGDLDKIVSETIPALLKLKQQGLVRHIGITGLPLRIFQYVLDRRAARMHARARAHAPPLLGHTRPSPARAGACMRPAPPGSVDTILSYCHYTPSDRTLLDLIPYLQERGVGIINASVLSMGLFTPQGAPEWHPAPQQLKEAAAAAVAAAAANGVSLPKLALMDAVRELAIATHLVGLCNPEQVRENVAAVLQGLGLAPRPQAAAEEAAAAEAARLLQPVQGLGWPSAAEAKRAWQARWRAQCKAREAEQAARAEELRRAIDAELLERARLEAAHNALQAADIHQQELLGVAQAASMVAATEEAVRQQLLWEMEQQELEQRAQWQAAQWHEVQLSEAGLVPLLAPTSRAPSSGTGGSAGSTFAGPSGQTPCSAMDCSHAPGAAAPLDDAAATASFGSDPRGAVGSLLSAGAAARPAPGGGACSGGGGGVLDPLWRAGRRITERLGLEAVVAGVLWPSDVQIQRVARGGLDAPPRPQQRGTAGPVRCAARANRRAPIAAAPRWPHPRRSMVAQVSPDDMRDREASFKRMLSGLLAEWEVNIGSRPALEERVSRLVVLRTRVLRAMAASRWELLASMIAAVLPPPSAGPRAPSPEAEALLARCLASCPRVTARVAASCSLYAARVAACRQRAAGELASLRAGLAAGLRAWEGQPRCEALASLMAAHPGIVHAGGGVAAWAQWEVLAMVELQKSIQEAVSPIDMARLVVAWHPFTMDPSAALGWVLQRTQGRGGAGDGAHLVAPTAPGPAVGA